MRKIQALLLLFAILLASCTSEDPGSSYAWCYTYDFAADDYGVNIISGSWVNGEGLRADATGLLQVNWTHTQPVSPKRVSVTVVRPPTTEGDVAVNASAIAFGVSVEVYGAVLWADTDEVTLNFDADYAGASGQSVNFTMDNDPLQSPDLPLSIASVTFYGDFASPFPENPCAVPTTTPSATATDPLAPTATATETPTPTDTPTVSPNMVWASEWIARDWHFIDVGNIQYPDGTSMGNHPPAGEFIGVIARYYDVNVTGTHSAGQHMTFDFRNQIPYPEILGDFTNFGGLTWNIQNDAECYLYSVRAFSGLPDWTVNAAAICAEFGVGDEAIDASGNPQSAMVSGAARTAFGFHWANNKAEHTGTFQIRYLYYGIPPTPTPVPTITPSITPTRTPLWGGTPPFVNPPTRTPLAVGTSTPGNTPTVIPASNTPAPPLPSRTLVPLPTAVPPPTAVPGDPNPNPTGENDPEWEILGRIGDFFSWLQNMFFGLIDLFNQFWRWLAGTAANILTMIGNVLAGISDFFNGIVAFIQELFDIGRLLIQIITRLIELLMSWIVSAVTRVGLVLNGFFTAPLIPIPGLPLCATNPMGSEVCAIYYILDYTLLAQGTPGQYIIPLVTIVINVFVVLFFVRFVLRIIRRGESVTNVG